MTALRQRMLDELQLRNLSACTIRAYVGAVERFAEYFRQPPQRLGAEQVREYLLHLIRDKQAPANTVRVNRAGLRFLYACTLKQCWFEENIPARSPWVQLLYCGCSIRRKGTPTVPGGPRRSPNTKGRCLHAGP